MTEHTHIWVPGKGGSSRTLVLLHGTGGDERDLLPVAAILDPDAAVLGVRGRVLENGMPRFFRRLAIGVLDEDDVQLRAGELVHFIQDSSARYGFDPAGVVAVGFSNGANIAAAVLWNHPEAFPRAILLRPMLPYREVLPATLRAVRNKVFVSAGRVDPYSPVTEIASLADRLRMVGAEVTVFWDNAGHNLTQPAVIAARDWLNGGPQGEG